MVLHIPLHMQCMSTDTHIHLEIMITKPIEAYIYMSEYLGNEQPIILLCVVHHTHSGHKYIVYVLVPKQVSLRYICEAYIVTVN